MEAVFCFPSERVGDNMKLIAWGVVLYLSYCGFLFFFQRAILFPRSQTTPMPHAADKIPGLEKIRLDLPFGQVESWYLPPVSNDKPRPVLIFAHGNAELIDHWPAFLHPLTRFGIGVLLVEYPGYGRSDGSPSQESVTAAFVEAYDRIVERKDVAPDQVVFAGRSIGGGAVCALAEKKKTRRPYPDVGV
jgi:pimeloyl-ACP methyl ester carboxylesterase